MTLRDNLKAVRALIAKGWTRGAYARDDNGSVIDYDDPKASCHCLRGAALAVGTVRERQKLHTALMRQTKYEQGLVIFNDAEGRTQDDVLELIDRAIEAAA